MINSVLPYLDFDKCSLEKSEKCRPWPDCLLGEALFAQTSVFRFYHVKIKLNLYHNPQMPDLQHEILRNVQGLH